jgi:hypothetical protein
MMVLQPTIAPLIKTMLEEAKKQKWTEDQKMLEFTNLCVIEWKKARDEHQRHRQSLMDGPRRAHVQNVELAVKRYRVAMHEDEKKHVMDALRGLLTIDRDIKRVDQLIRQNDKFLQQANSLKSKEQSNQSREIRKGFAAIAKAHGWLDADKTAENNEDEREIDSHMQEVRKVEEDYEKEEARNDHETDNDILQKMFASFMHGSVAEPSQTQDLQFQGKDHTLKQSKNAQYNSLEDHTDDEKHADNDEKQTVFDIDDRAIELSITQHRPYEGVYMVDV